MSYLKKIDNNTIAVDCLSIPDDKLFDAVKVRDICKARVLSRKERKAYNIEPGSGDIKLLSATGEESMISRQELVNNFVHSNGNKIKLPILNCNTDYVVVRQCNTPYKIMYLPNNCRGFIQGKSIKQFSYIILPLNEDGKTVNREKITVLSRDLFKKCFVIPMQPIISRHLNDNMQSIPVQNRVPVVSIPKEEKIVPVELNKVKPNLVKPTLAKPANIMENVNRNQVANKYEFTVVNAIMNNSGTVIGYTVKRLRDGLTRQLLVSEVIKLCAARKVDNVMLATKESTGLKYLRGNGIQLSSLPTIIA